MNSPLLVTGGTGTLGSLVVARLREDHGPVRVLSRHRHESADGVEYVTGDLETGEGVDAAVDGVETVVHCAGGPKGDDDKARGLARAASRAGVRHLVNVSVVGADRVPVASSLDRAMFGYFASKRAAEKVVAGSGLPWTTLRAAQFHELMLMVARAMAKLPLLVAPAGFRFQPIAAAEVADRLVELSLGAPRGLAPEIAGPRIEEAGDLLREYLRATRRRRPVVPLPVPGQAARAVRGGANLAPDHADGRQTWTDFLSSKEIHQLA